jgi:hypothetical protein
MRQFFSRAGEYVGSVEDAFPRPITFPKALSSLSGRVEGMAELAVTLGSLERGWPARDSKGVW